MNVEGFKGSFSDLARLNRFEMYLSRLGNTALSCKGAAAPGQTIDAMDVNYQGRIVKLPGDRTVADWTVTFYGTTDYTVYRLLKQWAEQMNDPQANVGAPPAAIKEDARVVQLGRLGEQLFEWNLVGCFPTDVAQIDFDWGSNTTPLEFQATFAFDYVRS